MDFHEKENLIKKSRFSTGIISLLRVSWWPLIDFTGLPEFYACDREKRHLKLTAVCMDIGEYFNDIVLEIEYVGSNAGCIDRRCSYLPWNACPT